MLCGWGVSRVLTRKKGGGLNADLAKIQKTNITSFCRSCASGAAQECREPTARITTEDKPNVKLDVLFFS